MSTIFRVLRAGPLASIQDEGRFGMLRHGISASGPMDGSAFRAASLGGRGGLEITTAGIELEAMEGNCRIGFSGGRFKIRINGKAIDWPGSADIRRGDIIAITPGPAGNYGYVRFDSDIAAEPVLGSIATSTRAGLGGITGRALRAGDVIALADIATRTIAQPATPEATGLIRVIWGLHADLFAPDVRAGFFAAQFRVSTRMDRMGVRLEDNDRVFADATILSLVSDAIVPGDIQILGDGTPIVLMRDHQPTGGYPRIATVITADLDRFAQLRPGCAVAFEPVGVDHAQALLRRDRP